MNNDHGPSIISKDEKRLLAVLRKRPALSERLQSILALTETEDGKMLTADEVEGLLIEELRKLGNETMQQWAEASEEQLAGELREKEPRARVRKKNA